MGVGFKGTIIGGRGEGCLSPQVQGLPNVHVVQSKLVQAYISGILICRQLCLIRTDVDPKYLSGLDKIRIMRIGIICIGTDWDLPICPA